ncbi:hypothetical protein PLICRDRAFT_90895 [Plicaturopsis crispa FD-325 SS-3]|nr:hypothetical protein PLICRDRAFT_90895 [Plicaturopsis crispa FD-325 SS-3]
MANSKFAYVRKFELPDPLLLGTFMVFRLDGHAFHRFSDEHGFAKPNDERALQLMDRAARDLMAEYEDIVFGFGESDEFSFLLKKSTALYHRRNAKIVSMLTSFFTSSYVFHWRTFFPDTPLRYPPSFDGRVVLYPTEREVRDYFSWRQADTHINNLYNTVFWALVQQGGETTTQAHATLRGTVSAQKHELLFSRFGINYNQISARYRKGSIIVREISHHQPFDPTTSTTPQKDANDDVLSLTASEESTEESVLPPNKVATSGKKGKGKTKVQTTIEVHHCDIIRDEFWKERPNLLVD